MPIATEDIRESYHILTSADGAMGIQLMGRIDHRRAAPLIKTLKNEISSRHPVKVTFDLNRITYFDDFGVLVLAEIRKFLQEDHIPFGLIQPQAGRGAGLV